jgi:hypothetical protein
MDEKELWDLKDKNYTIMQEINNKLSNVFYWIRNDQERLQQGDTFEKQ